MKSEHKILLTLSIIALIITVANGLEFKSNQPIDFHNNLDLKDNYLTNNDVNGGIKINTTSGNSKWIFKEVNDSVLGGTPLPMLSIKGIASEGAIAEEEISTDIGITTNGFSISHYGGSGVGKPSGLGLGTGGRERDVFLDREGNFNINRGKLDLKGNNLTSSSTGNVSIGQDLKVYGDVWTQGADLAEIYSSPQNLEAGDVVAINTEKDNSVVKTSEKYQETVTGVISTNPGQTLNWQENGYPVALTGKVPAKVSEENGRIQRGDRITPSTEEGVAMKCEIWDPTQKTHKPVRDIISHNEDCRSSTIGKALEKSENKDKILVKVG